MHIPCNSISKALRLHRKKVGVYTRKWNISWLLHIMHCGWTGVIPLFIVNIHKVDSHIWALAWYCAYLWKCVHFTDSKHPPDSWRCHHSFTVTIIHHHMISTTHTQLEREGGDERKVGSREGGREEGGETTKDVRIVQTQNIPPTDTSYTFICEEVTHIYIHWHSGKV